MKLLARSVLISMILTAPVMAAPGAPSAPPATPPTEPHAKLKGAVPPPKTPEERQERLANRQKHKKGMQDFLKGNPAEQQQVTEERNKHQQEMKDDQKKLSETKDPAARQQLIKGLQEKIDAHYRQMQVQMKRLAAPLKK